MAVTRAWKIFLAVVFLSDKRFTIHGVRGTTTASAKTHPIANRGRFTSIPSSKTPPKNASPVERHSDHTRPRNFNTKFVGVSTSVCDAVRCSTARNFSAVSPEGSREPRAYRTTHETGFDPSRGVVHFESHAAVLLMKTA